MATNFFKVSQGLNIKPKTASSVSALGDMDVDTTSNKLNLHNGTSSSPVVTEAHTATLTNKSIDASTNTLSNIANASISASAAIDATKIANGTVSSTAFQYLSGVTSDIQTQLNGKQASGTYIASLTGDVTATGPGAAAATIAANAVSNAKFRQSSALSVVGNSTNATADVADIAAGADANILRRSGTAIGFGSIDLAQSGAVGSSILGSANGGTGVNNAGTLTYGASNITLTTSGATSLTLPTSGTVATLAGTQTLTNKTFGDAITLTQIATPSTPSAGTNKVYTKSDNSLYVLNSAGTETQLGSGSGGINYIANPNAESDTSGWATYSNTAANTPSTGTGGTATGLTFARSTSSPLRGVASFLLTQANSTNLQGKGVSYDFTIDSADQAGMLTVQFNYNASSTFVASNGSTPPLNDGTTTTNAGNSDVEVFLYDKTNAVLIPVSPQVLAGNGTNNFKFVGSFQTASNSTSYRLILHVATSSANATGWALKFDNVSVGPQVTTIAPPITDWQTYTMTIGGSSSAPTKGTVVLDQAKWRRVGDSMEISYEYQQTAGGASGSGTYLFPLPSGYSIDTNKLSTLVQNANGSGSVGVAGVVSAGSNANGSWTGVYNSTNLMIWTTIGGVEGAVASNNGTLGGGAGNTRFSMQALVPISGWSANTISSSDTDNRIITALLTGTPAAATALNPIILPTVSKDTSGSYNASTGQFTAPVSGYYQVSFYSSATQWTGATNSFVYVAGAEAAKAGFGASSGALVANAEVFATAGQTIDVRASVTSTSGMGASSMSITRVTGPAVVTATESVNMSYGLTTAASTSATTVVKYDTKQYDSHNAYSTSTGLYTVPVAGVYRVSAVLEASTANTIYLVKTGTAVTNITSMISSATFNSGSVSVKCLAGDTLGIYTTSGSTTLGATSVQGFQNYVSIERVGN